MGKKEWLESIEGLSDSTLIPFNTDKSVTKLDNSTNGFISDLNIRGKTEVVGENLLDFSGKNISATGYYTIRPKEITLTGVYTVVNPTKKEVSIFPNAYRLVPDLITVINFNNRVINDITGFPSLGWNNDNKNDLYKIMLLEGDWSNRTIPDKPCLKSVGEDERNKIEILSMKDDEVIGDKLVIQLNEPLRGINDSIYDEIKDGVLYRRCAVRKYQSGDENNKDVITDKINTVYQISNPIIESIASSLLLSTFKDCNFKINNSIAPIISGKYSSSIAGSIEGVCQGVKTSLNDMKTDNTRLTTAKDITGAINELFTSASNGKQNWVDVIGTPLVNTDTFSTLKSKTQDLKNTLASNLTAKEQSSSGNESLMNLISKVGNIENKSIKSFQSGSATISKNEILTVNIEQIDLSSTILVLANFYQTPVKLYFIDNKSFKIESLYLYSSVTIEWRVIEFNTVKVQRGISRVDYGKSESINIEKVNKDKSFILITQTNSSSDNINGSVGCDFSSNTSFYVSTSNRPYAEFSWQVMEFL